MEVDLIGTTVHSNRPATSQTLIDQDITRFLTADTNGRLPAFAAGAVMAEVRHRPIVAVEQLQHSRAGHRDQSQQRGST
jgi:hypothetical protein